MRRVIRLIRFAVIAICFASPAMAQVKGPVAPALTPEQIALSKSMALKFDEGAAKEQRRLETFANRPLGAIIQRSFNIESNYLAMAAQMMPESSYGFRPTPELRTFGEQINHAAATQYSFCNQVGLPPGVERETMVRPLPTSKDAIVAAYKASTAYCDRVLAAAQESWLMEIVPAVGGPSSGQIKGARAHIFIYNALHTTDDYGTITTYLRMQGVVPPSSALEPPPAPARGSTPQ
jgi:uncharacterized damage-inducible protein DinB